MLRSGLRLSSWRPEAVFGTLGATFGLLFAFASPPLGTPDARMHLSRAFLLSEGHFGLAIDAVGPIAVPSSFGQLHRTLEHKRARLAPRRFTDTEIQNAFAVPLEADDRMRPRRASLQPSLGYLPPAVGVWLGRLFDWGPARLELLGRLGNLAVWLAVGWAALRLTARRAWAFCAVLLFPTSLAQATTLSPDALCNSLAVLLVALVTRSAAAKPEHISRAEVAALIACSAALGFSKMGYAFLSLLVLLVPARRFPSGAARVGTAAASILVALAPSIIWLLMTAGVASETTPDASMKGNPLEQLAYILENPVRYLSTLTESIRLRGGTWFAGSVGVLGLANIWLPPALYVLLPSCAVLASLFDAPDPETFQGRYRVLTIAVALAGLLLVPTIGYVVWNEVGRHLIAGVQGRYFLPLAPTLLLALPALGQRAPQLVRRAAPVVAASVAALSVLALSLALYELMRAFYSTPH